MSYRLYSLKNSTSQKKLPNFKVERVYHYNYSLLPNCQRSKNLFYPIFITSIHINHFTFKSKKIKKKIEKKKEIGEIYFLLKMTFISQVFPKDCRTE
jgi:hypothetical protein